MNTQPQVIDILSSPKGVYLGSEIIEGYGKLLTDEVDILSKRRAALQAAILDANKAAIQKAFLLSKGKEPVCEGSVATLSIRISPAIEEKPYNEATPANLLPPAALAIAKPGRYGEKYTLIVVSVVFVARWVCLPKGSIPGLPKDSVTPSKIKTHIGNNTYDFGCPHPSIDKVTDYQKEELHTKPMLLQAFTEKYATFDEVFIKDIEDHMFNEMFTELEALPNCPMECPETDLSITMGYPQPFYSTGSEQIRVLERLENLIMPPATQHVMTKVKYEQYYYKMDGDWSYSMQRTCSDN